MNSYLEGQMISEQDRKIAQELKRRISEVVPLIDFKVFGSRARGDADEYSDMDVFIEVETITRDIQEKISGISWELSLDHLIHIAIIIFTRDELEKTPVRSSPIILNIREEGVGV